MSSAAVSHHAAAQFAALSVRGCRRGVSEPEAYSFWHAITLLLGSMPESGFDGDVAVRVLEKVADVPPEWIDFLFFCPGEGGASDVLLLVSRRSGTFRAVDVLPGLAIERSGESVFVVAKGTEGSCPGTMHWWGSSVAGDWAGEAPFVEVEPGVRAVTVPKGATLRFMATFS